jgi:hypothetical protein
MTARLPGGTPGNLVPSDALHISVGDVVGHDLHAAAVMGQVRIALRAYALDGRSPADVVTRLDRFMTEAEIKFATTVVVSYDPASRVFEAVSAGHLPPLLIIPDGDTRFSRGRVAGARWGAQAHRDSRFDQPGEEHPGQEDRRTAHVRARVPHRLKTYLDSRLRELDGRGSAASSRRNAQPAGLGDLRVRRACRHPPLTLGDARRLLSSGSQNLDG